MVTTINDQAKDLLSYVDVKVYIHEPGPDFDYWKMCVVSELAEEQGKEEGSWLSFPSLDEALEIARTAASNKAEIVFWKPCAADYQ